MTKLENDHIFERVRRLFGIPTKSAFANICGATISTYDAFITGRRKPNKAFVLAVCYIVLTHPHNAVQEQDREFMVRMLKLKFQDTILMGER